jgi:protoporphyrinogen oxidase
MAEEHKFEHDTDPSALSTAALQREIASLKEQFRSELQGEVKVLGARLAAIDRATVVFEAGLTNVPTALQEAISHLKEYHGERFVGVEKQFSDLRIAIDKSERVTKVAVDAALEAAGKAAGAQAESFAQSIDKSEKATAKQIDQIVTLLQAATAAMNDKNEDTKERLNRIEGQAIGHLGAKTEGKDSNSFTVAVIAVIVAFLAIAVSVILHFSGR